MLIASCTKENDDPNNNTQTYSTSGNSSGSQVVPPVATSGSGTLSGTYNASTNIWQYNITWSSLTTAATIIEVRGPANAGFNGSLLFSIDNITGGINGNATGNMTLTADQETYLLGDKCYYTILTPTNVAGEIRGQIIATAQ